MKKRNVFSSKSRDGWPDLREMEPYFLNPERQGRFERGSDGASLTIEGVNGTEHLSGKDRINVELLMWSDRHHGVMLIYSKVGGGYREVYTSEGNLIRLREYVLTRHGDEMPIGLYIPFHKAWEAVREFVETDGQLPRSIEWIANEDLPPNTFPQS